MIKRLLSLVLALTRIVCALLMGQASAQTACCVTQMVSDMSLRDKVTQMLMVDFRDWGVAGASATDFTVMNDEVRQIIEDYNFGSIILFADNIKYINLVSAEDFGCTIEAYTYPDEFAECDGSAAIAVGVNIGQQARKTFGLCYRTIVGNDVDSNGHGYKLHLIYGCLAAPSEKSYATVNDSPEAITFSWEVSATPVNVTGYKPTACLTIDSTKVAAEKMALIEDALYGTESEQPAMLMPDEIVAIING